MDETNRYLGEEKVGRLMRGYAVPCIISLLVGALYNIVDQIFIANASYLGSNGNAANTAVFPLTIVALSVAVMIGDGCCAFAGFSLGMKRDADAKRSVGNAIVMTVASSIVITAVYLLFRDELISMFGATVNDETFALSQEYMFFISVGIPFYMFGQAMNPIIRGDGSPRFAMAATLSGAIANIILDPIFIYAFRWGMAGAAIATVAGQVLVALLSIWYILHMKQLKPRGRDFVLKARICQRTLALGGTSFMSQISIVFSMAAVNNMVRIHGAADPIFGQKEFAQIPLAVLGIVMKFFQIVISVVVGMAAGCIPIVSFNMGASLKGRVKELFAKLLVGEVVVGLVALVLVELFPKALIGVFGAANESAHYTAFALKSFRIYLCMIVFACVNKACFIVIQAMGQALASTLLSLLREIVFGVGFALLLPAFFGLDGVLYSMPASDLLTFLIAVALIIAVFRKLNTPDEMERTAQDG